MSDIENWESEGGSVDHSPGVVMVLPQSALEDEEIRELVREAKRERVRIQVVNEHTWRGWLRMIDAMEDFNRDEEYRQMAEEETEEDRAIRRAMRGRTR